MHFLYGKGKKEDKLMQPTQNSNGAFEGLILEHHFSENGTVSKGEDSLDVLEDADILN